ncbi:MAG: acyltransferase [Bacillota bacterium]|nr:acyltransferase [Bacillota bacterium]
MGNGSLEFQNSSNAILADVKGVENKMKVKQSFHLDGADGIRAIACLSVIIHHLTQRLTMQAQSAFGQQMQSFFLLGNTGVSVFFVLSGFLLSFPFWKQYLWEEKYPSIKQYALRRAARIMPGYYASLLVTGLIVPLLFSIPTQSMWERLLAGFGFVSGFNYVTFFPCDINGPLWSIGFEVFCYLLMPLFMFGLFSFLGSRRSFKKALLYWIGVFVFITGVNQLIHTFLTPGPVNRGWEYGIVGGAKYWMPNYNPVGFFSHFAIGIIAAGVTAWLFKNSQKITALKNKGIFDIIGVFCILGAVLLLWCMRHAPEFSWSLQNQPYYFPFYAILIAGALVAAPHSKAFGKILDNRFFKYTAKVSFGLYIWHCLVIYIVTRLWMHNFEVNMMVSFPKWLLTSAVVLVGAYIFAALSYKFIEKPVLNWAHRKKV